MRKHFKKGAIVPRHIVKMVNKHDQKFIRFDSSVFVVGRSIINLKKANQLIVFGVEKPNRRSAPVKDWSGRMKNISFYTINKFTSNYTKYAVAVEKFV